MIRALSAKNFKCFQDINIPFNGLTVLTGLNGMGKSSVVQMLLLLRQSHLSGDLEAGRLALSGELVSLGTGGDVLFEGAEEDVLALGIAVAVPGPEEVRCEFSYKYDRQLDRLESLDPLRDGEQCRKAIFAARPPFSNNFTYLQAERLGPRKLLELAETRARRQDVGSKGEYVLHILLNHGQMTLPTDDPRLVENESKTLLAQVEAWLQDVSPGTHLSLEPIRNADAAIAGYSFDRPGDVRSKTFRATNVGFGISYALPVIVALLVSQPGALVVIENPEAHMHPRGQTRLGQLAARAAAAGVQVVVETHSDHFIDGVRIDVKHAALESRKVAFHYFARAASSSKFVSPELGADGRLSEWPEGFFDQRELNLAALISSIKRTP